MFPHLVRASPGWHAATKAITTSTTKTKEEEGQRRRIT